MSFDNLQVKHKSFGDGVVVDKNGKYITVEFATAKKTFVYPDVFAGYLTLADGTVNEEILADIEKMQKAKQDIIDRKNAENLRAMTRGIVIPGKEASADAEDEDSRFKSQNGDEI